MSLITRYPIAPAHGTLSPYRQAPDRLPFIEPDELRAIFESVGLNVDTGLPLIGPHREPHPEDGEFEYSMAELANPRGNNTSSALRMFEERKKYRATPYFMGLPDPMDSWYDKLYFGRVDRIQNGILANAQLFKEIPSESGNIMVFNFVAVAFQKLKRYMQSYIDAGLASTDSLYYNLVAARGFQDPLKVLDGLHAGVGSIFENRIMSNVAIDNRVIDFKSYIKEFVNFMDLQLIKIPLTPTGFMVSNFSNPMMSGLSIELYQEDYGDDSIKFKKYMMDPNFRFFVRAARKFGFYVDRNAPWRLIADPFSQPMLDLNFYTEQSFFNIYYTRTMRMDFANIVDFKIAKFQLNLILAQLTAGAMNASAEVVNWIKSTLAVGRHRLGYTLPMILMRLYNDFVAKYPRLVKKTTSSVRCPHGRYSEIRSRSAATENDIAQYGDLYWLDLYFKIRMREANVFFTNYNAKFQKVRQFYKFYGPQAQAAGVAASQGVGTGGINRHDQLANMKMLCSNTLVMTDPSTGAIMDMTGQWPSFVTEPACDLVKEIEPDMFTVDGVDQSVRYINNEIKPYLYDLQVGAKKKLTLEAGPVRIGSVKDY
jgi:hypothetical protein